MRSSHAREELPPSHRATEVELNSAGCEAPRPGVRPAPPADPTDLGTVGGACGNVRSVADEH